jgi:hypothetical protein
MQTPSPLQLLEQKRSSAMIDIGADHRNRHSLIVEYSDGTTAIYSVEQLRDLKPQQTASADSKLRGSK